MAQHYEYAVFHVNRPDEPHRDGLTESEAREWVREWDEESVFPGVFVVKRRPVGEWENDPNN